MVIHNETVCINNEDNAAHDFYKWENDNDIYYSTASLFI